MLPYLIPILSCLLPAAEGPVRGLAALQAPAGFTVEIAARPEISSYPMFMAFDLQGRLFVAESSGVDRKTKEQVAGPDMMILMLEDTNGDGRFDTRTVFADQLALPMGVLWHQDSLYVAAPPDFLRLQDTDGDGVADVREVLLTGWNVLNTASLHGPFLGPDGWLYLTHGRHGYKITSREGAVFEGMAARIWRCKPDGTQLERFAGGGFDNPVEIVFTPSGELLGTMTYFQDPRNGQRDGLMHWVEGGVYPKPGEVTSEFIRTGDLMPTMSKFARIAPSGLEYYRGDAFGAAYLGNLFSAQFNPHRVQRHRLFRDGATYRTEDEDFLTSTDPDFHPTDVLEDADGSLLVCDTGAWYVDACPISRVAKPEIRGGIYRIRREGAPVVEDPWGRSIDWANLTWDQIAAHLADPRPRVRDAARVVITPGAESMPALLKVLESEQEMLRTEAVWLLGTLEAPQARAAVRQALSDPSETVRLAAVQMVALSEDREAVPDLIRALQDGHPAVRRQAATALGRLGATESADALIQAAANPADRFEEHAIIYALIQLEEPAPLVAALQAAGPATRKAALIALDQMPGDRLTREHFAPFLEEQDPALRKTALWVASRHPGWSDLVLDAVHARLRLPALDAEGRESVREVVAGYQANTDLQEMLASVVQAPEFPEAQRLFVLDLMDATTVNPFPDLWVRALGAVLEQGAPAERLRVVTMAGKRALTDFDARLRALAEDAQEAAALRVAAFTATGGRSGSPSPALLDFLLAEVRNSMDPVQRLAAAKALKTARLDAPQLQTLARDYLSSADAMTFAALLEAFQQVQGETVGLGLVAALAHAPITPSQIPGGLDALLANFPPSVAEAAAPLRAQVEAETEERVSRLLELEPLLGTGDVGRGRQLFFGDLANCHACHAVGEEGGRLGPDLTTIGTVRTGHDLLEAILFPSASFVPDYEPYRIDTEEDIFSGNIIAQTEDTVTLATGVNAETLIQRKDILEMRPHTVSIMPEGLDAALTREELIDLVTFMQSLNDEHWLLPQRREGEGP